ncbi:TfuA-like protein [Kribbella sp. NPDC059898]|uniref:TfuA-like protein n=1 Tax=Kribbella sp. NPDC059898 TaxID=3346995 RepID=UPI00365CCA18
MRVAVFAGPTIAAADVTAAAAVEHRPPAAAGDVAQAVDEGFAALLIIDGYFHSVPSVQHKELLYALGSGVAVFGSSSMGALRAAELHGTPVVGVGAIYRAYRDGELTDDDEVAVAHAAEEHGFRPISVPMVTIRHGLRAAVRDRVLGAEVADRLVALSKARFYADRHWAHVYQDVERCSIPFSGSRALRAYVERTEPDPKRADAVEALGVVRDWIAAGGPTPPAVSFEPTNAWDNFRFEESAHH